MLKYFLILVAAAFLFQASAAQATEEKRPEVGRYVKAYAGTENVKAWTTRIGQGNRTYIAYTPDRRNPLCGRVLVSHLPLVSHP